MKRIIILSISSFILLAHSLVFAEVININKADVAALDKLNGIGAKKAESIIAWRDKHGEFKSLDAIKDVPGIGDKLFEKIKNDIALTDSAPSTTSVTAESNKADTPTPAAANLLPTTAANNTIAVKADTVKAEAAKTENAVSTKIAPPAPANTSSNSSAAPTLNTTIVADKKS